MVTEYPASIKQACGAAGLSWARRATRCLRYRRRVDVEVLDALIGAVERNVVVRVVAELGDGRVLGWIHTQRGLAHPPALRGNALAGSITDSLD